VQVAVITNGDNGAPGRAAKRDSSFDFVLAIEAVSHYLDYARFLAEAHRVLRPGGKLLIIDGNNRLNPAIRRHCEHIWPLHEREMSSTTKTLAVRPEAPTNHRTELSGDRCI
jgi:SAM-dependent methyltransferase